MVTNIYLLFTIFIAALSGILFGFDTGVISGAILFIDQEFQLTPSMNGLVVSSVLLGATTAALVSGSLADLLGRRKILLVNAILFIIGTVISSLAHSISMLIIGRLIVGAAIGIASYTAPLYISEIAPTAYRGRLVSLNQLAITIGITLSYVVDYAFTDMQQWRFMFGTGVIPAAMLLIGLMVLPESPRWLMLKNQSDNAKKTIIKLFKTHHLIEKELSYLNELRITYPNYKTHCTWVIGLVLASIQQLCGINTIIYYAPTILTNTGLISNNSALFIAMIIGMTFISFTLVAIFLVDKLGRRQLLLTGLSGMLVTLFAMIICFQQGHPLLLQWIAPFCMCCYIAFFAFSLGPIVWLMIAEIYPLAIRAKAASITTAVNWGCNLIVALTFLTLVNLLTLSGVFIIYSIICMIGIIFIYYCVPETKNIPLEQLEANLQRGLTYRQLGNPACI